MLRAGLTPGERVHLQRCDSVEATLCRVVWNAAARSTGMQSCVPLTELLDLGHPTDTVISAFARAIVQGNTSQATPGCLQTGE